MEKQEFVENEKDHDVSMNSILDGRCADMAWFCMRYCPISPGYPTSIAMLKLQCVGRTIRKLLRVLQQSNSDAQTVFAYTWFISRKAECLDAAKTVARFTRRRARRRAVPLSARKILMDGSQSFPFSAADLSAPSLGTPVVSMKTASHSRFLARNLETAKVQRELNRRWWMSTEQEREEQKKTESIVSLLFETPTDKRDVLEDIEPAMSPKEESIFNAPSPTPLREDSRSPACERMDAWLQSRRDKPFTLATQRSVVERKKVDVVLDDGKKVSVARLYRLRKGSRNAPRRAWLETLAVREIRPKHAAS